MVFVVLICFFVLRLILPYAALWGINWALENKLGSYEGHVKDLDLSLYRGAYQLVDLEINKKYSDLLPLLAAQTIELSLSWHALLRFEISADIIVNELVVSIFDSQKKEKQQLGDEESKKSWQSYLRIIIPVHVESLEVSNSAIHFNNYDIAKNLPVSLEKIHFTAHDLRSRSENLSPIAFEGILQKNAEVSVDGNIDILAAKFRAYLKYSVVNLNIPSLNPILLSYVPVNFDKGIFTMYGETALSRGKVKGYANIFFKDVKAFEPKQKFVSVKHFAIETLFAITNWILKNQKDKTLATHIPFEYSDDHLKVPSWQVFWSAEKNRTVEIPMGFDHSIHLQDLEK
jgi:hypothetical protein